MVDNARPPAGRFGRELVLRIVSALVLVALVAVFLWLGGWPFAGLAAVAAVLILREWIGMTGPYEQRMAPWATLAFAGFTALMAFVDPWRSALVTLAVAGGLVLAGSAERRLVWLGLGVAYATLPGVAVVALRQAGGATPVLGPLAVVFVFLVVWATDTAAYFSGRTIGGPKLAPRLSPKKTWSGAIGGLLAAVVVALAFAAFVGLAAGPAVAAVAVALSVVSQIGDLSESAMKRHFDVKDSGSLIPGHGGVMDRVDGLIFALILAVLIGLLRGGDSGIAAGLLVW